MPYQRGSLTGKFHPGQPVADGHRARLQGDRLADDIAAAERFRALADARSGGMGELAMQYVLHERRTRSPSGRRRTAWQADGGTRGPRCTALWSGSASSGRGPGS